MLRLTALHGEQKVRAETVAACAMAVRPTFTDFGRSKLEDTVAKYIAPITKGVLR